MDPSETPPGPEPEELPPEVLDQLEYGLGREYVYESEGKLYHHPFPHFDADEPGRAFDESIPRFEPFVRLHDDLMHQGVYDPLHVREKLDTDSEQAQRLRMKFCESAP